MRRRHARSSHRACGSPRRHQRRVARPRSRAGTVLRRRAGPDRPAGGDGAHGGAPHALHVARRRRRRRGRVRSRTGYRPRCTPLGQHALPLRRTGAHGSGRSDPGHAGHIARGSDRALSRRCRSRARRRRATLPRPRRHRHRRGVRRRQGRRDRHRHPARGRHRRSGARRVG